MTEPADFKEARKKRHRKTTLRRTRKLLFVLLILAALALLIFAARYFGWGSHFGNLFSSLSGGGAGFPVELEQSEDTELIGVKGGAAVSQSGSVTVYNKKGEPVGVFPNSYTSPHTLYNGGRLLTFDLGGSDWQITSNTKVLHTEEGTGAITAAALGTRGEAAVARRSPTALAEVKVYSPRFEVMYIWQSTESYPTALAVSHDGQSLAAGGIASSGGALSSVVTVHDMTGRREIVSHTLPDSIVLSMTWTRKGNLQVVTDRALLLYNEAGELLKEVPLPEAPAAVENCPEGGCYIALGDYRLAGGTRVTAYDSEVNVTGETAVHRRVLSLCYSDRRLYILAEGQLLLGDASLSEVKEREHGALRQIAPAGRTYYALTEAGLVRQKL